MGKIFLAYIISIGLMGVHGGVYAIAPCTQTGLGTAKCQVVSCLDYTYYGACDPNMLGIDTYVKDLMEMPKGTVYDEGKSFAIVNAAGDVPIVSAILYSASSCPTGYRIADVSIGEYIHTSLPCCINVDYPSPMPTVKTCVCGGCSDSCVDGPVESLGGGRLRKIQRRCNCNVCEETPQYHCAAGYYGPGTTCTPCPPPGTSAEWSTTRDRCYIKTFKDNTGEGHFKDSANNDQCHYK